MPKRISASLFIGVMVLAAVAAADTLTGTASVIDGDTIEIHGQRIRFYGIDAPESHQLCRKPDGSDWRCGQQAALALSDQIGRGTVSCEAKDKDRYGRIVAVCRKGNEDLNGWMVRQGWAVAYRQYSTDYVQAETDARSQRSNIWSGDFVKPSDWRKGKRLPGEGGKIADPSASSGTQGAGGNDGGHRPGCDIKGNISSSGKRIYHVPGGRWYEKTRIDPANGERWFCSEAEAKAAGWTPAAQ